MSYSHSAFVHSKSPSDQQAARLAQLNRAMEAEFLIRGDLTDNSLEEAVWWS